MKIKHKIVELSKEFHHGVIGIRRHIHMHPELSFEEVETGKFIQRKLDAIGIKYKSGWAGHGVVGLIEGNRPDSGVIALRADMDALPILEENDVEYASKNPGVMHACGHDVHTSSLLGAAQILHAVKDRFDGTIKLIFQPGEERTPGGASIMIKEGVLENPEPTSIIGQHVYSPLPAGHYGFRAGPFMASADEIELRIVGKGGHGAMPHLTIDPIAITAQVLTGMQQIVSRVIDPTLPSVLTFGKIESEGGTYNVIPGAVKVLGTFRTFDESWRDKALRSIKQVAEGVADSFGAKCEVNITRGYPFLVNDAELTELSKASAAEIVGADCVHDIPMRMTAEDFSYYSHRMPGCFYRMGIANQERHITSAVHTPTFDIDENALQSGPAVMSWIALRRLAEGA